MASTSGSSRPSSSRPSGSGGRPSEPRQVQQDFITKVRYINQLPPPPNPPKLLDIAVDPIAEYTSTKFVSRLVRDQPLTIEMDSELGMPLDLLPFGPEIFSTKSSEANQVIRSAERIPKVDERDKPLLRPISSLGTAPKNTAAGVSFLRRTEYISSEVSKSNFKSTTSQALVDRAVQATTKNAAQLDTDPLNMLKAVLNGFDIANPPSGKPWNYPKHPTKKNVTAVDSFPLLPDLKSHPDGLGYVIVKLSTNPTGNPHKRDPGLDYALLQPWNDDGATEESRFHYYLPDSDAVSHGVKRRYEELNANDEDDYTHVSEAGRKHFKYRRQRAYEYVVPPQVVKDTYSEVVLVLNDGEDGRQKGAYFSPIFQRNNLRPMRSKNKQDEDPNTTDLAEVRFRELLPEESARIEEQVNALTELS